MGIEQVVNIIIRQGVPPITREAFDTPLFASASPRAGVDRVRIYNSAAAVRADYPDLSPTRQSPEYLWASRVFSQARKPSQVAIGKRANLPTQSFTLVPKPGTGLTYAYRVGTQVVSYTAEGAATVAEITPEIAATHDTVAGAAALLEATSTATSTKLTATSAGLFVPFEVLTPATLSVTQDQADAGIAADLSAFLAASSAWYGITTPFKSQAEVMAIAAWTETNRKFFVYSTIDSAVINTAYDPAAADATVGGALRVRDYARTMGTLYELATDEFMDAAVMARLFGPEPGSTTIANKRLVGVRPVPLTDPQVANLRSYNGNPYVSFSNAATLLNGRMASGAWPDYVRDTDAFARAMQEDVFNAFQAAEKMPQTDSGVTMLENPVRGRAEKGVTSGFLKEGGWTLTSTPIAQQDPADLENRNYGGMQLVAERAGAIQTANPITITFTS